MEKSLHNGDPDVIRTHGLVPHYSGIGTCKQCCGLGFGRSDLSDPDRHPGPTDPKPDHYPFQSTIKLNYTFYKKLQSHFKNIEIMTPITLSSKRYHTTV
jgi:hypothetical protein